jgi:hypothetical protein
MRVTSEGPIKITKNTIEKAWRRRNKEQRPVMRDKDCRGLALIVNATSMTWSYSYRPRGVRRAAPCCGYLSSVHWWRSRDRRTNRVCMATGCERFF